MFSNCCSYVIVFACIVVQYYKELNAAYVALYPSAQQPAARALPTAVPKPRSRGGSPTACPEKAKRKCDEAEKRRDQIMAKMKSMQQTFLAKNAILFKKMEEELRGAAGGCAQLEPDSGAGSLMPSLSGSGPHCCAGASRAPFDCSLDRHKCIYCQEEALVSVESISVPAPKDHGPLVFLAFVQRSNLFASATGKPLGIQFERVVGLLVVLVYSS